MRDLPSAHRRGCADVLGPLLAPLADAPPVGGRRLGSLAGAVGVAAPFGRLAAAQLRRLAALAAEAGAARAAAVAVAHVYVEVAGRVAADRLTRARGRSD